MVEPQVPQEQVGHEDVGQRVRRRTGSTSFRGKLTLLIASTLVSLAVAEMALRALTPFPITSTSNQRPHDELLYVNAGLPDLDPLGFRNAGPPDGQPVFAIGDSHTYGFNVVRDRAWPQRLEEISGVGVYNFGVGGYNIYHYFRLFELALEHGAGQVIVAFYPSNDLSAEACRILGLDYWRDRGPALGLASAECAEVWRLEVDSPGGSSPRVESVKVRVKTWLRTHVALVGALDHVLWNPIQRALTAGGGGTRAWEDADFFRVSEVVASARVRRQLVLEDGEAMNLDLPIVQQHLDNSLRLFHLMRDRADAEGVRLSVMVIPSKGRVIASWGSRVSATIPEELENTRQIEEELTRFYLSFLAETGIPAVDLGPAMVWLFTREAAAGIETYSDLDGHPMASGYLEYAKAALGLLGPVGGDDGVR